MTHPEQQAQPGDFEATNPPSQQPTQPSVEQRLVERCARTFHQTGLSLMAGRVLAYTMLDDAGAHTPHEFSLGLGVSTAAVSYGGFAYWETRPSFPLPCGQAFRCGCR